MQRSAPPHNMVLQVQGQRVACDAATLAHLKAVQLFLDDNSTEQDAAEMLFQLPEWVTLELWERVAAFPGLKVPEGTEALLTYSACRSYLKQHWQHLTDIMQLSDFLGVDQLTELCTSALLVHLRELLRKHILAGKPIPKPELKAALMQPISTVGTTVMNSPVVHGMAAGNGCGTAAWREVCLSLAQAQVAQSALA